MRDDSLLEKYLEGTLTSEERAAVQDRLAQDSEWSRRFVEYVAETAVMISAASRVEALAKESDLGMAAWRPGRSRATWAWLAVAAAVLAAAGVWWISHQSSAFAPRATADKSVISDQLRGGVVVAKVEEKVSGVRCQVGDGDKRELKVGDEVREGMRIETGEGGRVKMAWVGEETEVEASERSTLNIQHRTSKEEKRLLLERGRLSAVVGKQEEGRSFVLATPHTEMTVVGTKFSVAALEDRTRLMVEEGKVKMRALEASEGQDVESGGMAVVRQGGKEVIRPGKTRQTLDVKAWGLGTPQGVAFDGKQVWLYMLESATLVAMDPDTLKIVKRVKVEQPFPENTGGASGLAWDGKSLWGWSAEGLLRAVDPNTGKTVRELRVGDSAQYPPFDIQNGVLWISQRATMAKQLFSVDLKSGAILTKTQIDDPSFNTKQLDSMCCGPDIVLVTVRRDRIITAAGLDSGRLLYQFGVEAGPYGFYGGDIAYDSKRGVWCALGKTRVLLVEAE